MSGIMHTLCAASRASPVCRKAALFAMLQSRKKHNFHVVFLKKVGRCYIERAESRELAFSVSGPVAWNALPATSRNINSKLFKQLLTFYNCSFDITA